MTQVIRRAATVLGAAALALVLAAVPALADTSIPGTGPYRGSTVKSLPDVTKPITSLPYSGFVLRDGIQVSKPTVRASMKPTACSSSSPAATTVGSNELVSGRTRNDFAGALPFAPKRNGVYTLQVCIAGAPVIEALQAVRLPAPVVTNVVASAAARTVTVTWDDMSAAAPDLGAYLVQRRIGTDGEFVQIASVKSDTFSFADSDLPADGGDATYRVLASRPLVDDSAPSEEASATFAAAPSTVPGSTGTDAGPSGSGGTTGPTVPGGSGGKSPVHVTPHQTNRVVLRAPRVGTPSNAFFPPLLSPPKVTEVDTGYNPELPYDPETGDEAAVLPADELSSSNDDLPGRGLAVPAATALVLAVWALHLRYLAAASKPVYVDDFLEPLS